MFLLTIILYFMDIHNYGKEYVYQNCNFFERIGRWFILCGWFEILVMYYILTKIL